MTKADIAVLKGGPLRPAPAWVPQDARHYLAHTEAGLPIRALARSAGCHASTILRQIRRLENRRDDLLVDEALRRLGYSHFHPMPGAAPPGARQPDTIQPDTIPKEVAPMQTELPQTTSDQEDAPSAETLRLEARRVLRRLAEPGAVLAVAAEMDKAVVVRDGSGGATTRTAVVERAVAQAMALKEWISCDAPGRISRYRITGAGRAALSALMAEAESIAARGFAEGPARFAPAPILNPRAEAGAGERGAEAQPKRRRVRYSVAESPLLALARRRDKAGTPFLSDELVSAGERLREDFELSQMGPNVTQNWDGFLTGGVRGTGSATTGRTRGPEAARARIAAALRDLGPGLGDVALRCCCYLEGLEQAERRMGWSARSGKIVLRIALQRLRRHYDDPAQDNGLIG